MKRIQYYLNARNETKRQNQMKFVEAIKEDDEPTCRQLLEEGLVIFNECLPIGTEASFCATYPLCVAAFYGSMNVINLLIDYGADVNFDGDGKRPIFWALYSIYSSVNSICLLLERGSTSASVLEDLFNFERPMKEIKQILHFMLRTKIFTPEEVIKIILWKFIPICLNLFTLLFAITKNPNIVNINGDTILFTISNLNVVSSGDLKNRLHIIRGLINLGVNPSHKNNYNFTAADFAAHEDIRQLLLEYIP